MRLQDCLATLPGTLVPEQLDRFRAQIDAAWVEEALFATGSASIRRRRLPAEQVLWLVVGMALLRNESIDRVVSMLDLALPASGGLAAKSGIAKARQRLGAEPIAYLFTTTADHWAHESAGQHRWRRLSLYGLDGSTFRVPDSDENWSAFGGQIGNGTRAGSAYPMVRLVALMALRSHLIAGARFGAYSNGEATLADGLWSEIPDDSLTIVDRNFARASLLAPFAATGRNRHWLIRALSAMKLKRLERLGPGDDLVEIAISRQTREKHPELPERWIARAIRYRRKGHPPGMLLTSLVEATRFPASEMIALYHERWELEIGYDEVKTHLLAREEAIRSRTPSGVAQELWGVLLAYNLVRLEILRAADEVGVSPTRISFVNALSLIRYAFLSASTQPLAPARIPETLLDVRRNLQLLLLPERRERTYPRAVKLKMSAYLKKSPRRRK